MEEEVSWVDVDFEIQREKERNARPVLRGEYDCTLAKLLDETHSLQRRVAELEKRLGNSKTEVIVCLVQLKWLLRTAKDPRVSPDVALLCMEQMTEAV